MVIDGWATLTLQSTKKAHFFFQKKGKKWGKKCTWMKYHIYKKYAYSETPKKSLYFSRAHGVFGGWWMMGIFNEPSVRVAVTFRVAMHPPIYFQIIVTIYSSINSIQQKVLYISTLNLIQFDLEKALLFPKSLECKNTENYINGLDMAIDWCTCVRV